MLIRQQARYARNVGLTPLLPLLIFLSLIKNRGTVAKPGFSTIQIFYSKNCYGYTCFLSLSRLPHKDKGRQRGVEPCEDGDDVFFGKGHAS